MTQKSPNFNLHISVDSNSETKFISDIAAAIKNLVDEYGQQVLTVLSFGSDSNEITKDIFQKAFTDIMTIELSDAISAGKETHAYLKRLADSYNLSCRHKLYSELDKTADSFHPKDLKAYFKKWHNDLLQTKYYSQYANLKVATPEKPAETRMGSGKGSPEYWVAVVKPGRVLFELSGVAEETAREAMRLASHKLPVKTKFVTKRDFEEMGGER